MTAEEALGRPAARVQRDKGGQVIAVHCLLRYSQPVGQAEAIAKVQAGKITFVAREDVHQVLDALGVAAQ